MRALGLVLLSTWVSACGSLQTCSEDDGYRSGSATLSGLLLAPDGGPLVGGTLSLTRSQAFDLFHPQNDFEKSASADATGAFSFTLSNDELRNGAGANLRFFLGSNATPGTTLAFDVNRANVKLPALQGWNAQGSAQVSAGGIALSWADLGTGRGLSALTYDVSLLTGDESSVPPTWKVVTTEHSLSTTAAQLEDFKPTAFSATPSGTSCGSGSLFAQTFAPATAEVGGTPAAAPVSRGAPCTADVAQSSGSTCPVTTGTLDYLVFDDSFSTHPKYLTVDLGSSRPVHRVVARGLAPFGSNPDSNGVRPAHKLEISVSADGQTFTHALGPIALAPGQNGCFADLTVTCYLDLAIEPAVAARYVRVGLVQDLALDVNGNNLAVFSGLTQLSVWDH